MATEKHDIACYGTEVTKVRAKKSWLDKHGNDDDFNPDLTFSRDFPVVPDNWDEPEYVDNWINSVRACWGLKSYNDVAQKINKHIADNYRRQYHAPAGQPSGKIMMHFMINAPQDQIDTVQALMKESQTDEAYEIIKAF